VYNAIKGAGYVISPVVGGAVVWASSFEVVFLACFGVGVLAFLLSLGLLSGSSDAKLEEEDEDSLSLRKFGDISRDRLLLPWYGIIVVNMFFVGILFGFLPVYVHSLGYNRLKNGLIVATAASAYLLIQPLAGWLADRSDPMKVILLGLLLSSFGVLLTPFTTGAMLVVVALLGGAGVGTVWTNSDAMVSQLARERRLASSLGMASSFKELGDMLGPLLIGAIAQAFGLRVSFISCGILGLAGILALKFGIETQAAGSRRSLP